VPVEEGGSFGMSNDVGDFVFHVEPEDIRLATVFGQADDGLVGSEPPGSTAH
jgi:hypothetical protein